MNLGDTPGEIKERMGKRKAIYSTMSMGEINQSIIDFLRDNNVDSIEELFSK